MLYKFKSKAAGDLIMLEPNGQRVLEIIGKDSGAKGIILPDQMQAAINALEQAVAQEEAQRQAALDQAASEGKAPPKFEAVSLRQRAHPMIEMLRRCHKAGADIVWGV
jgi:Domain of unknown function (DUF1840)